MSHQNTIFGQFLKLLPRHVFDRLAGAHHHGRMLREMSRWAQFVALVTGQLAGRHSRRDIVANLEAQGGRLYHLGLRRVARSSLARVNAEQPAGFYEALFGELAARCRRPAPRHRLRFKNKLYSLDATLIDLSLKVFPWAEYTRSKAAVKLHVGLDHDGYLPAFVAITEGKKSDIAVARRLALPRGSVVVCDKGCTDFAWYKDLTERGIYFVSRARDNACVEVLEARPVRPGSGLLFDQTVRMTGVKPTEIGLRALRRIGYRCPETGKEYVFLTNAFHLAARTIAEIYKQRWQIELFFKWLKQNLKIKAFVGTSKNAILTQIWVALCVQLLLAYLKFLSKTGRSLQEILRPIQVNLFLRRDLGALIHGDARDPTPKWQQNQLVLL
jgi:putative transposase